MLNLAVGSSILCCHTNRANQIQVLRINSNEWFLEYAIFPRKRLLFEAMFASQLEIHTGASITSILLNTIPYVRLQVKDSFLSHSK